jgi:hypothetical protein
VKRSYAAASIVSAERIVFNIKGNDYRLVVAVDFEKGIVWIKWIGSHEDYAEIEVTEMEHDGCGEADSLGGRLRSRAVRGRAAVGCENWDTRRGPARRARYSPRRLRGRTSPDGPPDPVETIKFRMEQQGLTRRDLEGIIGTRTRVAEVLNRKRGLSIGMIRRLHERLGISAEVLIRPSRKDAA